MNKQLQAVLDRQADALESRNPQISAIRLEIGQLLGSLEIQLSSELKTTDAKLSKQLQLRELQEARNAKTKEALSKTELERQDLESGELASDLDDFRHELDEIDKQLALLSSRRSVVLTKIAESESVIKARQSRINQLILSLQKEIQTFDSTTLVALEQTKSDTHSELTATKKGKVMWGQICESLRNLDEKIDGADLREILPILEETSHFLFQSLETARAEKWGLLVTAIGHEYAVIEQALDAVRASV